MFVITWSIFVHLLLQRIPRGYIKSIECEIKFGFQLIKNRINCLRTNFHDNVDVRCLITMKVIIPNCFCFLSVYTVF